MNDKHKIDKFITDKLFPYQINHLNKLLKVIQTNGTGLDHSSTGTGKTYTAVALCKSMKLFPIIITPKSVMSTWRKVCDLFKVKDRIIVNYETLKMGNYYINGNRVNCPYLSVIKDEKDHVTYEWQNLPDNAIFIYDEAHRCSISSQNAQLLLASKRTNKHILLLSATIADTPEKFRLFTYILNFIDPEQAIDLTYHEYINVINSWFSRDKDPMIRIYRMLNQNRASRMRIADLPDFPETQIIAESYDIGKKREKEIEEAYSELAEALDELQDKSIKDKANVLVKIMRAHQRIELIKIPLFVELANDMRHNGFSVVIFVNFTQTLKILADMLKTDCVIYGEQTLEQREKNIENFQSNKVRTCIANIKAGSIGLSLHDLDGKYPRCSLISPCWNATDLKQALGRVHRAGGQSKSLQRIVYAANTIEEKIKEALVRKLTNLNAINDGDLNLKDIIFKKNKERVKKI